MALLIFYIVTIAASSASLAPRSMGPQRTLRPSCAIYRICDISRAMSMWVEIQYFTYTCHYGHPQLRGLTRQCISSFPISTPVLILDNIFQYCSLTLMPDPLGMLVPGMCCASIYSFVVR